MRLIADDSVRRLNAERDLPAYQQVKQASLRQRRETLGTPPSDLSELMSLLEAELDAKESEVEEAQQLGIQAEASRELIRAESTRHGRKTYG